VPEVPEPEYRLPDGMPRVSLKTHNEMDHARGLIVSGPKVSEYKHTGAQFSRLNVAPIPHVIKEVYVEKTVDRPVERKVEPRYETRTIQEPDTVQEIVHVHCTCDKHKTHKK